MSKTRFTVLLLMVILCAAGTIWVGAMAAQTGKLDRQVFTALLPLILLGTLAWRRLRGDQD